MRTGWHVESNMSASLVWSVHSPLNRTEERYTDKR